MPPRRKKTSIGRPTGVKHSMRGSSPARVTVRAPGGKYSTTKVMGYTRYRSKLGPFAAKENKPMESSRELRGQNRINAKLESPFKDTEFRNPFDVIKENIKKDLDRKMKEINNFDLNIGSTSEKTDINNVVRKKGLMSEAKKLGGELQEIENNTIDFGISQAYNDIKITKNIKNIPVTNNTTSHFDTSSERTKGIKQNIVYGHYKREGYTRRGQWTNPNYYGDFTYTQGRYSGRTRTSGKFSYSAPERYAEGTNLRETAMERHYKDYLSRPFSIKRGTGAPIGGSGMYAPELVFRITLDPYIYAMFQTYTNEKRLNLNTKHLLDDLNQRIANFYRELVFYTNEKIIGNPAPGIYSGGGYIPKGGTGYLRQMTRNYMTRQSYYNRSFPIEMYFSVPVHYAKYLADKKVSHNHEMAWRVVDYTPEVGGLRSKGERVMLYDPKAVNDFFKVCIDKIRERAIYKFKETIRVFENVHADELTKLEKNFRFLFKRDERFHLLLKDFIIEPSQFNTDMGFVSF